MLNVTTLDKNGRETPLDRLLTAELDCDLTVPADSLTVSCPFDSRLRQSVTALRLYDGGKMIFTGQADSVVTVKQDKGVILRISARSPAALLLDNEAEPVTYFDPADSLMESRHLRPFGVRLASRDPVPYYDMLKIDKGMSHWRVLQRFCRCRYHTEPRVSGDGTAYLNGGYAHGSVTFSDCGNGIAYTSLKENCRRHRLLSEIRLKFQQDDSYHSVIKNPNPEARLVTRVRYVNAAADKTTLDTADKMFEDSNRDSYALTLRCAGCLASLTGSRAVVRDSVLGTLRNLLVRRVRCTADGSGESSEITLEKENFNVADELHNG